MDTKHIKICDYDYNLPDHRIAKFPKEHRDESKLLLYNHSNISEDIFRTLPSYIPQGTLMVFNNTRVIHARLHFRKDTGAQIEVFLLEPSLPSDYEEMFQSVGSCSWMCLIGNLKKWKTGELSLSVPMADGRTATLRATNLGQRGTSFLVSLVWDGGYSFSEIIDAAGELPIPPYLNRATQESDTRTYQTVYSKIKGSVAAPTAGLHFTSEVLSALDGRGVEREEVTLHVGAGTFKPVKSEEIEGHDMHTEFFSVARTTIARLLAHNCEALAVGTTSVRTLESLYYLGLMVSENPATEPEQLHVTQWMPYEGDLADAHLDAVASLQALLDYMDAHHLPVLHASTQIIIAPGYKYRIVRMLITNFHQPKSTLLLLVSAFVHGDWRSIYDYALQHDFRFLSYGDSSLIIP